MDSYYPHRYQAPYNRVKLRQEEDQSKETQIFFKSGLGRHHAEPEPDLAWTRQTSFLTSFSFRLRGLLKLLHTNLLLV